MKPLLHGHIVTGILTGTMLATVCAAAAGQTPGSGSAVQPQFSPRPLPAQLQPATARAAATSAAPLSVAAAAPAPRQASPQAPQPVHASRAPVETGDDPFYVLHPGDTVDVVFRFTPEFNDEVVIGPDGRASLKSIGDIRLAGRTLPELERLVIQGSSDRLVDPEVTVSLKDFERPHVTVAGEVSNPQIVELRRPLTVLDAILIAGGPKDDAALGRVLLFRKIDSETAEVHVLKLGRYDARTRAKNNLVLQPGDAILVRHDNLSRIERYVKLANVGFYLNPLGNNGLF